MITSKLGRKKEHRERTLRNLATSLFLYEKLTTTVAKAKTLGPIAERLITTARADTLAARRSLKATLLDQNAVSKLFDDLSNRQANRTSGFIRITKLGNRAGDGAPMAQIELLFTPVEEVIEKQSQTKLKVRKTTKAEAPAEATPEESL